MKQLISSREAIPATCQHTKPCSDCPFSRKALHGWTGSVTPEEWVQHAHGETLVECHAHTGVQCAGIAIYRANVLKAPRHQEILRLPADRIRVFSSAEEFLNHHSHLGESQ